MLRNFIFLFYPLLRVIIITANSSYDRSYRIQMRENNLVSVNSSTPICLLTSCSGETPQVGNMFDNNNLSAWVINPYRGVKRNFSMAAEFNFSSSTVKIKYIYFQFEINSLGSKMILLFHGLSIKRKLIFNSNCNDYFWLRENDSFSNCYKYDLGKFETNISLVSSVRGIEYSKIFTKVQLLIYGKVGSVIDLKTFHIFGWEKLSISFIKNKRTYNVYKAIKKRNIMTSNQIETSCSSNEIQIYPSYGPITGGQILSFLYGSCLFKNLSFKISIGKYILEPSGEQNIYYIDGSNANIINQTWITPPFDNEDLGKNLQVKVCYQGQNYYSNLPAVFYTPVEEPTLTNISRNSTIASGGLIVTFSGNNLNSTPNPWIDIIGENKFYQPVRASSVDVYPGTISTRKICKPYQNGTQLKCYFPALIPPPYVVYEYYLELNIGLKPNNSFNYISINLISNPAFKIISPNPYIMTDNVMGENIPIYGSKLETKYFKNDYSVCIGNTQNDSCLKITATFENVLFFIPPSIRPNCDTCSVFVNIGNLNQSVGTITYNVPFNTAPVIGGVLGGLAVLALIILIICLFICKYEKICCFKEKIKVLQNRYQPSMKLIDFMDIQLKTNVLSLYIEYDKIIIQDQIGKGQFGIVYKGKFRDKDVAIKTLKIDPSITFKDKSKFVEEAIMMIDFKHRNILSLIGVTFDKSDNPLAILPFMKNGDLKTYLSKEENVFTDMDYLNICVQSACGMEYLASKKFIHRDLAARNCMVDDEMIIKIADFGLARDMNENDYYIPKSRNIPLPYKWMAIECLNGKNKYSEKTDVWSFGVLMWEIYTRGMSPYFRLNYEELVIYLKRGKRLEKPENTPTRIYAVMLSCWDLEPKFRPTFQDIVLDLNSYSHDNPDERSYGKIKSTDSSYENFAILE